MTHAVKPFVLAFLRSKGTKFRSGILRLTMHASVLRSSQMHRHTAVTMVRALTGAQAAGRCMSSEAKPRRRLPRMSQMPYVKERQAVMDALDEEAKASGLPWRIVGACALERYPVIHDEPEPWEAAFWEVQEKIATIREKAFHEGLGEQASIFSEANPSMEEMMNSLPFTPAPRITEADTKNDRRSLERALNDSLYLLVKRGREDFSWQFPQGQWKEGENMRQVAERVIERTIGPHKNYFVGNAPIGVLSYKYPDELQQKRKQYGAKVFFFRAQFVSGAVQLERRLYKDHAWVTRDEVAEYLDKSFAEYAFKML